MTNKVTLPDSITLAPEMTYFWQVEASFGAGEIVLSDMGHFVYEPK